MKEEKDFGGAVFLISIGVLFLLNTTGVIGWGIWSFLLEYWPVIIVMWGIKLIIGDSFIANIVMGVISLFVYTTVIAFAYVAYTHNSIPFLSDEMNKKISTPIFQSFDGEYTEDSNSIKSDEFQGIELRNLEINVGASEFTLTENTESDDYFSLNSKYVANHIEPEIVYSKNNNNLDIQFSTKSPRNIFSFRNLSPKFDLVLGKTNLPTNLDIELGAGDGTISLENALIEELNAKVGAGNLEMTLLNKSTPKKITVEIGAANMDLTISKEAGFSVEYKVGVGDLSIDNESLVSFASDNTYKSSNYDTASNKIEIIVKIGAGALNIITK